jgi:hypothetical protein
VLDLEGLCTKLLAEGSVALVRGDLLMDAGAGIHVRLDREAQTQTGVSAPPSDRYILLSNTVTLDPALPFTSTQFAQRFWGMHNGEAKEITRIFSRGESAWSVRDYVDHGTERARQITEVTVPLAGVISYPNGLGILYRSQRAYRRLEAIFATIERLQSGVNAKTIISGYVGSTEQAHVELRRPDRDVALFPSGTLVHRVASTSAIDQLMREFETLLPLYLRRMHFVHVQSDARLSGVSRRLAMAPMIAFVEKLRSQCAEVVALCGGQLMFDPGSWERVIGKRND